MCKYSISIIVVDQEKSTIAIKDRAFAQCDLFLAQQCSLTYNFSSTVIASRALGYYVIVFLKICNSKLKTLKCKLQCNNFDLCEVKCF